MASAYRVVPEYLLKVTGSPASLVTLAEAKDHLEIDHSDKDTYITSLVAAASQMIDGAEGMVGKPVGQQTVTYSIKDAPSNDIYLPIFPVKSITSISYIDTDGNSQSIGTSDFRLIGNEDYAVIETVDGYEWPSVFDRQDAITFTLLCGFDVVPDALKHACLMLVAHWFENREAAGEQSIRGIDFAVDALVNRYRKGWVAA